MRADRNGCLPADTPQTRRIRRHSCKINEYDRLPFERHLFVTVRKCCVSLSGASTQSLPGPHRQTAVLCRQNCSHPIGHQPGAEHRRPCQGFECRRIAHHRTLCLRQRHAQIFWRRIPGPRGTDRGRHGVRLSCRLACRRRRESVIPIPSTRGARIRRNRGLRKPQNDTTSYPQQSVWFKIEAEVNFSTGAILRYFDELNFTSNKASGTNGFL